MIYIGWGYLPLDATCKAIPSSRMVEVADDYCSGDLVEAMCEEDLIWYSGVVQDRISGWLR